MADLIEAKTGIEIQDIAENRLDEAQWEQLRDFEVQNKQAILAAYVELDKNDVERERIAQADRSGARAMQAQVVASGDRMASRFIYFYATLLTVLTFVFIFYASFFHDYAAFPKSERVIDTVLGFLLGVALSAVVQYFFGSSAGSKNKQEQINQLLESGK